MVKPFNPHSSIRAPAVRGPPGFLKTEPQHGWSNGVPAFRHRSRRACNSFSFAGGSSINASFASSTITLPRFEERYLNEICLRGTCRVFPLASITVASVSTSANSAPCAPAFMYTPPPTVPGIPMKRSTPAKPASAVRRASSGVGRHDEVARRSADAVRGMAGQGLILEHPPAELDLGRGRRGRGGRLGGTLARLPRRLGRYLRYARTASFAVPGGRFSTVVLSCHSWRLLTLPVRLRRAMIASQAALAADMVVVYGTRCISAARRIA